MNAQDKKRWYAIRGIGKPRWYAYEFTPSELKNLKKGYEYHGPYNSHTGAMVASKPEIKRS